MLLLLNNKHRSSGTVPIDPDDAAGVIVNYEFIPSASFVMLNGATTVVAVPDGDATTTTNRIATAPNDTDLTANNLTQASASLKPVSRTTGMAPASTTSKLTFATPVTLAGEYMLFAVVSGTGAINIAGCDKATAQNGMFRVDFANGIYSLGAGASGITDESSAPPALSLVMFGRDSMDSEWSRFTGQPGYTEHGDMVSGTYNLTQMLIAASNNTNIGSDVTTRALALAIVSTFNLATADGIAAWLFSRFGVGF